MPKISVVTVNYNNASGLERTLQSVSNQTYADYEFIVVDGGSTDGSKELISQYASTITTSVSENDNGAYDAMNRGIAMSTGDYVLFLNSGDHLTDADSLSRSSDYLDAELVLFDIQVKGQGKDFVKQHPDEITFSFLFNDTLAHQSVFIKRSLFDRFGHYDTSYKIVSDWKFFLNAFYQGVTHRTVHEVLSVYYLDGMSATAEGTFTRRDERDKILKEEYPIFYSDYEKLRLLDTNRFKMLKELEHSKAAWKLNSAWLRMLLRIFRNKSLKNL